jgi:hypothetical protein
MTYLLNPGTEPQTVIRCEVAPRALMMAAMVVLLAAVQALAEPPSPAVVFAHRTKARS